MSNTNMSNTNYNNNKYNYEIHNYMFSLKNITKFTSAIINTRSLVNTTRLLVNNKPKKEVNNKQNILNEMNNLFWLLYIIKNGYFKYDMIENCKFKTETDIKYNYVTLIRNNKDKLKMNKFKSINEMENDLVNNKQISLKTFIGLCILEGLNIMVIDNRKLFEIKNNDTNEVFVIKKVLDTNKYELLENIDADTLQNYRNTYYIIEDINNVKLKSISSYKLEDLINICGKMNIKCDNKDGKKMLKKDIYELIVKNI